MKLTQHPEYQRVYIANGEAFRLCEQAITQWRAHNDTISVPAYGLTWTYESAREFVRDLSTLFQEYNHILWNGFNYCRQCGGQCCVADASNVQPFDLLAITLLDQSAPVLAENISASERQCIYLVNRRCSWPAEWRTIKCWSFYCLGTGPWRPDTSISELRGEITRELQQLVRTRLPLPLQRYENIQGFALADSLDDPVAFSEAIHNALFEIFVDPLNEVYPIIDLQLGNNSSNTPPEPRDTLTTSLLLDDQVATFIAQAVEEASETPPVVPTELAISVEQLLQDLEALQWIIEGHPSHESKLLHELYLHYANAPAPAHGDPPSIWYRMCDYLSKM
ncbi:hypothetical protein KSC_015190 [Ktedonobacter sp. SOSP1-52]|uniref:hypothetical protein n=1 Tax=Ktedonobacter sp. SOSP1-52 TaxID=2778366 RepID=UPI00191604C8|nr:hypothetical protein [Ktedonobacter sp. SOSP1-52]GHO62627.1 hypothetical protein KSC_015190 [Ktedonobacter sp. SOSP1-52]